MKKQNIKINKELNKLDNKILFPEKLELTNKMLKNTRLPKQWKK